MKRAGFQCPECGAQPLHRISFTVHAPADVELPNHVRAQLACVQARLDALTRYRCTRCGIELTARELVEDWCERGSGVGVPADARAEVPA
jgi:predicted RNA-binding Zn-ribbon protein involved in translation (DUF1610 family)